MMRFVFGKSTRRWGLCVLGFATAAVPGQSALARPDDKVTYLLPAPKEAIVLAPFLLAEQEGRYRRENLDVRFVVVPGGFNVGEALARGEGDLGGGSGDTPIMLRASNLPVKGIALLGRHSFLTLVTRHDSFEESSTFDGKRINVPSLQDTSYYAVQKMADVAPGVALQIRTQARPPAELIAALGSRSIDGFVGTVDWGVKAEREGVKLDYRELDAIYPAMAQAIMASETTIAARPRVLRKFVRATLQTIRQIARDPDGAAMRYEAAVPSSGYSHAEIVRIFGLLATHVYGDLKLVGRFDEATVRSAEDELLERKLVMRRRTASDYFTNSIVGR
ncbi:MAG: ABC transporter substrate-binding protein [Novosphingobium sp.]